MDCRIEQRADRVVIAPEGRIDSSAVTSFMDAVLGVVRQGTLPVELDMQGVTFISSAGLRVLVIAQRDLDQRGQRLRVCGPNQAVNSVLHVAGLDALFDIRP
jgi:anti-sigma B factor antagonist